MHLTLIISSLNTGGAERVLSELSNYWASKGHTVTLVTLAHSQTKPFYPLDPQIQLIQLNQSQQESSSFGRLRNILRRIFYLRKTFRKLQPDVIISFVDIMNLTTLLATTGLNIPVIVSERTHPAYHHLPLLYQKVRHYLYPKAFCVVMQTASAARYFKHLSNITLIPNAVTQPLKTKEAISESVREIVSVGRLCPFKSYDTLIQAFSHFQHKYPHLKLTIYGDGKERQDLEKLIAKLHLQNRVSLPGTTPQIQKALAKADLFIFPSKYEGFPNALCEAMAMGLPVIASDCSGNIDIIQDEVNGRLFPTGDAQALTKISLELLEDSAQRSRLGTHAKEICIQFHPDRIHSLWDQLISSTVRP